MKNTLQYVALMCTSLCMGACSSETIKTEEILNDSEGEITEIVAVTSGFEMEGVNSRTVITMGSTSISSPVWAANDTIGIYPTVGDQLSFPIVDGVGTNTCVFNGGGWALKTSSSYTAYSPFNRSYYLKQNNALPISMLGQKQTGNDNSEHLGAYDIQIATGVTPASGKISFSFQHQVAIVRLDLVAPVAGTWTSLQLESDGEFTTDAVMDLTAATPTVTPVVYSNTVTLELEDVVTSAQGETITAYMMLLPVDLTDKTLTIYLTNSEDNMYEATATIKNDKFNFVASAARWITADSFTYNGDGSGSSGDFDPDL